MASETNGYRISWICILVIALLMGCFFVSKSISLQTQVDGYFEKQKELDEKIIEETQRTEKLMQKKKYVNTPEYYKEIAREKLGLIEPDEIILKEK